MDNDIAVPYGPNLAVDDILVFDDPRVANRQHRMRCAERVDNGHWVMESLWDGKFRVLRNPDVAETPQFLLRVADGGVAFHE